MAFFILFQLGLGIVSDCFKSIYILIYVFDGAEVCELVGLYLLHLLQETGVDLGLYRDDLLGVTRGSEVGPWRR